MIVKLLTEHHLEFLSLKGGCRGSSESTLVKMSNCWKSHAAAQIIIEIEQPLKMMNSLRSYNSYMPHKHYVLHTFIWAARRENLYSGFLTK